MAQATPTARLGAFAAACASKTFTAEVMDNAAYCLLDAFGLALIARAEPTVAAISALALTVAPQKRAAHLWTDGRLSSLNTAVEVNATAVHGHFHDDSDYSSWSHPGSLIVPPALTLGEGIGANLDSALRGIIAGYAAIDWLGAKESVARAMISKGVRTSPTLGTIGAAATAAAVLGLTAEQAVNAIGISTGITGGLLEPVRTGSDEWRLQNAHAARGGVLAGELARVGVLGAPSALEGPKGLLAAYAAMSELPKEWTEDPAPDAVVRAVAKPYATLGDNMAAAIAAKLLHEAGVDHRAIKAVRVTLWRPYSQYPGTDYRGPFTRTTQAMASTVFAVGAMLSLGHLDYAVNLEKRNDPNILRLAAMAVIEPDDVGGPEDSLIELTLSDGSKIGRHSREAPKTLLYHDRPYSRSLYADRAALAGYSRAKAEALTGAIFDSIDKGRSVPVSQLLGDFFG